MGVWTWPPFGEELYQHELDPKEVSLCVNNIPPFYFVCVTLLTASSVVIVLLRAY